MGLKKIILVGNPNTGKSMLFNALTGTYTTVSNFPGTTVEVAKDKSQIGDDVFEILDTPGMYSLIPITEEEVSRRIIMKTEASIVIHVADAKNLDRMLPLTLHLIESGLPVILVVNMMDEAKKKGIKITELKVGENCRVVNLDTSNAKRLQILLSMGILPGRHITILQAFPSNIFQVGQTQYAVDNNIANTIYVTSIETETE